MNRDLTFGIAGAAVAAVYSLLAVRIPDSALADAVGPQGLPKAYAAVLALLSLILIVRSLRSLRTQNPEPRTSDPGSRIPDPGSRTPDLYRVAGMLLIGITYLLIVPWLGYAVALAGLLLATTWYQGGVASRTIAAVAVSGAIVFWLLFVVLLRIPHPAGVWPRLF